MSQVASTRNIPALAICLWVGCSHGAVGTNPVSRAAAVLFDNFETVFYSAPALLSSSDAYGGLSKEETSNLRYPFVDLRLALEAVGKQLASLTIASSEAVLVGAKDFRPPEGVGPVRSQRCYVIIFGKRSAPRLEKVFDDRPVAFAAGAPVWNWRPVIGEFGQHPLKLGSPGQPSSFYAAVVAGSYLLVANRLSELQTVATRLTSAQDKSSVTLSRIRDWETTRQHALWGYRRYRHTGVPDRTAAALDSVTTSAEALIFFLESNRRAMLRLIASDDTTAKNMDLKPCGPGAWETTILFTGDEQSSRGAYRVISLFGFPIYP